MLIDYVVPYGLRESEGRSNSLICKLQCLAELRDDYHFRLFAPFCDYSPKLPKNVTLISQKRLASRLLQELFLNAKYLCYLLRKRPQCLIVRPDALFTAHFFAKLAKARLVLNIHSYPREEYKYVYSNIVGKAYTRAVDAIFSLSVKLADGIIFNHPDLQEYITHKYSYEHQTEFIYNGADTTRFYPMDKCSARRTLSISTDKAILLFLGSVAKWHGIEYLIEIASVLQAKSNDILMYIVGGHSATEEYMKGLAAAAPRNVIFTGKVDPDVANLYINAADVCLLPVKKIRVSPGSPSKLFDYIAAGRPVVTQEATTGYSDIVLSYELGYAIDFCDSASAAEKIVAIVKQCHETHYETHNRQVALTHLNWSNVADKWSSFIDKVVST